MSFQPAPKPQSPIPPPQPGAKRVKCRTIEDAVKRYGQIDFASKYWPEQDRWIKLFQVPVGWFPNWKVLDSDHRVTAIACNIDTHEPLMAALRMINDKGLGELLKTFDGCFNIRAVRGSTHISTHAYGLGFDFNASLNELGSKTGDFSRHMDVVNCFRSQGFDWGGDFYSRKDMMHFSYAWEGHFSL